MESPVELTRQLVLQFYGQGSPLLHDDPVSPGFVEHNPIPVPAGIEGLQQLRLVLNTAFSDIKVTIEDLLFDGDRAAVRLTAHAQHTGVFRGIAATGKAVTWTAIHILRVQDNKLVERWVEVDMLALCKQMVDIPQVD